MKKTQYTQWALAVALAFCLSGTAQTQQTFSGKKGTLTEQQLQRWSHLDLATDSIPGMSVDKMYAELIKDKKGSKVVVAIIDSGVDIEHEDLKSVLWTNTKEIAGNGIDDDKNGFVDDVHGWNFLGNDLHETLEMTRIVKKGDDGSLVYKKAKTAYDKKYAEAMQGKQQVDFIMNVDQVVQKHLQKKAYTLDEVKAITTVDPELLNAKTVMTQILTNAAGADFAGQLEEYRKYVYDQLNYNLNLELDGRKLVGDNPNDIKNTKYGNNTVAGPEKEEALHGTHVAGIVAQSRNNGLGGDGVANNVEIMTLRAVPDGDEYDKDIALAIRYAADNGAKVINGSFGKSFSPQKQWVYDAIKYAEKKDVLFVHAAGNDGLNIDLPENSNFPNDSDDYKTEFAANVITVGAINYNYGPEVITSFSNYGAFNVDVFAPGDEIYATIPNNKYKYLQGTSMASPNVAGVAAMIRSYFPKLSAKQVKQILMNSGTPLPENVVVGEKKEQKKATEVARSAKMVNAYNAFQMAQQMTTGPKNKKKIQG